MAKIIDLNKTVYELVKEYPELIAIMSGLGFTEITKKPVLHSVGRIMTIPKGAGMKNIPLGKVLEAFRENGFELSGSSGHTEESKQQKDIAEKSMEEPTSRSAQLKAYLRRLGDGEALKDVREDFVREFGEVEASEIMKAEQELMKEGTPLTEVQRLCDIHSALFHGATKEERIANAERAVEESLKKMNTHATHDDRDKNALALAAIGGHPLHTLTEENKALTVLLEQYKQSKAVELIPKIRELSIHYAKKGDLLYPLLNIRYDISGPANVMWTVDDEIRDELGNLMAEADHNDAWQSRLEAVLDRAEEMIYKEQNILFPICAANFTEQEWYGIYHDAKDYASCFDVSAGIWTEAETARTEADAKVDGEVIMPGGHMSIQQLTAMLNTIPLEISFVDADNINRYFNEGEKVFKRPSMAIDRDVFSCHPPKVEPMVRQIIVDFRNSLRDEVSVWMEKNGRTMLVKYMAVRDKRGAYIGTLEIVQDMEFAKEHFLAESEVAQ